MNSKIRVNLKRVNVTETCTKYDISIEQNSITERGFIKPKEAFKAIKDIYHDTDYVFIEGNYKN